MRGRVNLWLLLAATLCATSLWVGWRSVRPGEPAPVTTVTGGELPGEAVHLLVLNGTNRAGLAREFSLLLVPAGCVTEAVANAPEGRWKQSMLVNRRLEPSRAAALAASLGGVPVVREWDDRTTEDAVLVLGQDWEAVRRALTGRPAGD